MGAPWVRVTDITDRAQCDALVARAVEEFGALDILVNDAYHGGDYSLFADADLANWRATSDVNVFGTLNMTQAALPALTASGSGRIVNICTHGVDVIQPTFGAYTSSKAAIAHLTQLLAAELGPYRDPGQRGVPGPDLGRRAPGLPRPGRRRRGVSTRRSCTTSSPSKSALKSQEHARRHRRLGRVPRVRHGASPITGQALYANSGECSTESFNRPSSPTLNPRGLS